MPGIIKVIKCISTQPYFVKRVMSSSEPGVVYDVTVPMPDDPPNERICTCKGFLYRGTCRHQTEAKICGWTSKDDPETEYHWTRQFLCPSCGNYTVEELEYEES
jgi:hypothetical protein